MTQMPAAVLVWNVYYGRQERPPQGSDQQYPHFTHEIVETEIDDR